ncbi:MAG: hypothetical protein ABIL25_06865 [candidate division WOR-3 bacterium]
MKNVILLVISVLAFMPDVGLASIPAPPVLLDSGLAYVRPQENQELPAAAFDGNNWLVVWQDERGERKAIWGARVSAAGVLLDSANILIADDEDNRYRPGVAFNGTCFLVVWQDARNRSYDIYGARVSPAGVVLDPDGFRISLSEQTDENPAVASLGSEFFVVWQDKRNSGNDEDVYGTRVSGSGQVLDTAGIPVAVAAKPQLRPSVASSGTGYLVTWQDLRNEATTGDDVYACRVTAAGVVLDPSGIAVSRAAETQERPKLASDGTNYLIVWGDERNGSGDVYSARVSSAGAVLDPAGLPIHPSPNFWAGDPCVAYTGSQYIVVWEDDSITGGEECDLLCSRVTASGTVLDPEGLVVTQAYEEQCWPAIAPGNSNLLVAWQDYRNTDNPDIFCNRLSSAGQLLDTVDVPVCGELHDYEQREPAVSFGGGNYLVVWRDDRRWEGWWSVYGARVSPTGAVLDPGGFRVAEHYLSLGPPCVAFGNSSHLVCWAERSGGYYEISGTRITPQGAVLDTLGINTRLWGYDAQPPAVAFDGTNWLVVAAMKYPGQEWNIVGSRIGPDGVPRDSVPIPVSMTPQEQDMPALAFGATNYLAVWSEFRSNTAYDIYGARIAPDGTVLDSAGIPISTAPRSQSAPSVAFDGTNWLVAWQDERDTPYRPYYYYARVSQAGIVLDTAGIPLGWCPDNYEDPLQMVFDGTSYFVVWQNKNYSNADLWGARISSQGAVLDSFPVFAGPECQQTPAVALGPGNQVMVVYSGFVDVLRGYPVETMRIWAGIYPFYGIEEGRRPTSSSSQPIATIARRTLLLPEASGVTYGTSPVLLDATGRKVMELAPGENDVSRLAPGVYFVHSAVANGNAPIFKVIVTR